MNNYRVLFIVVVLLGGVTAFATTHPLTNVAIDDNDSGWFTFDNLDDYGADLDRRLGADGYVFTGHPAYLMASDKAHLLYDMPRIHYFATTFGGTDVGDRFYANVTRALETGTADLAIAGPMTQAVLEEHGPAAEAFLANYCVVSDRETVALYNRTHSKLYRYAPDECSPGDRPSEAYVYDE